MASQEFTVLYTHQKMKKSKTWQDGILRVRTGRNQATLFDDKGQCLESIFIKSQVTPGDDLESERYLITVEAAKVSEKPSEERPKQAETPAVDRNGVKPALLPPRHLPVGLKRKFTGFRGPRQVEKKTPAVEDEGKAAVLPSSKGCQGSFPSQFYISSPLFSTVCRKDAGTNPSAGSQEEGCRDKGREQMSVSSLLSAPFSDSWEGTERQNSHQLAGKQESPLLTGHTGAGAVSHHIRSTAQIIALLKSKPAQGHHREQTFGATGCLSRVQAAQNAGLCDRKSPVLPAPSGDLAKGLVPDTQHLPFVQGNVKDTKDWNVLALANSAEQPCGEEVTGHRQDKKVNNLSQDLQGDCNTSSYFLPESTVSRMSGSQSVPSSGDISPSASPTTFESHPFGYREHSGTDRLRENCSVKMQSEFQPRQNSEGLSNDPELSGDVTLAEAGVGKEGTGCSPDGELMEVSFNLMEAFDFNDMDNEDVFEREGKGFSEGDTPSWSPGSFQGGDVAQGAAWSPHWKPHSCCDVETQSKNEVKCSKSDGEGGPPPQLCDSDARRAVEDAANQTKTQVELLGDGHNIKEISESQSSFEGSKQEEDMDGCAALTISGTSWLKKQHSDLLPGDTSVNECHPETRLSEATGSLTGISPGRIISALDQKTEGGVTQLGCMESPDAGSEHFWAARSGDMKPGSPLLALSQKSDPLGGGCSSPEETAVGGTVLENAECRTASPEACQGETVGVDCLKCTAVAENCSGFPDLVNDIALLRALTQHSTALESLRRMEENTNMFCGTDPPKETLEPLEKDQAIKEFTEMPYSDSLQASSCSYYFDSPALMPNCVDSLLQKTDAYIVPIAAAQRDPGPSDWQPKSPGSRSLHEDDVDIVGEGNFQVKPDVIEEPGINQCSLALDVHPEVPPWTVSHPPPDPRQAQWTAWEPGKISPEVTSPLDPDCAISPPWGNEEPVGDIQEPLTHGLLPSEPQLPDFFFTQEKSSRAQECSLPALTPTMKTRAPFVTVPASHEIAAMFYPSESEHFQQSLDSSGGNLCSQSVAFPRSAASARDRNSDPSVFGEYPEDGQRGSVPPALPDVTAQGRQSKWLKYQSSARSDLIPENSAEGEEEEDDICARSVLGMPAAEPGESRAADPNAASPAAPLAAGGRPGERSGAAGAAPVSAGNALALHLPQAPLSAAAQKVLSHLSCHGGTGEGQDITISELSFPPVDKVKHTNLPKRKISIPAVFQSHTHYKQVFKAALTEQLNIMLFELAQRLHHALSKVDISLYTAVKDGQSQAQGSCAPLCNHMHPAKLVMVKKEGQNKGRLFYACDAPKAEQCSFFKWIEDVNPTQTKSRAGAVLHDTKSIGTYLRSQKIAVYEESQLLVRKAFEIPTQRYSKFKKFMNTPASFDGDSKPKLYLKLSRKEHSSLYSKDDIWVVSKTLNFDPIDTFIASSAFFGPSSNNEIELLPLKGYSPSNWRSNMCVHALLVCNASGELASLRNMEEHFNPSTLPLIPYLLKMNFDSENATKRVNKRKFTPPAMSVKCSMMPGPVSSQVAMGVAEEMIQRFSLNPDQAASLIHVAQMITCEKPKGGEQHQSIPITIIRGVFGAGKSYLLSVVILFLVQLFESSEATESPRATPWKLLIASSTNVAVDRILLGLLELGFEDFIRVGSVRKITKAILPHSLHAGSGNENEQLKELLALLKEDLTPAEKIYVRKSIEQHKLGTNKTILQQVKVVGVTCAACPFPCLKALRFPVVVLDECSQMTEPASLLPIARFQCEKLILVGDPKQLPPTIQGSESVHEQGLEQTLFDRLCLMGHEPIVLRTQYRCHPALSAIANELFYSGHLIDGISQGDRAPLLEWLPTLCFYSVHGMEQIERDNSFYNMAEAHFTVKLIQSLIASGIEGADIGVITLYKSQMYKIQNLLSGVHSEAFEVKPVQVSTVDAFQGAEREIIVLSCVRTRHFGFIDSERRMNVALTRAKRHLLIVGSLPCLSRNRLWGRVIHHCRGWENGLQHASQCEQQLNDILKSYLENWEEEERCKKKEK
ncbi:5'-3' DNA helicase ZGRF1 isoform X2 [Zonotrichia leucophrys gambelii]|uniref:5'-3' DNA helicase ZGRF1 isoform X2 n=1 Tax=Zonotrichia leucophrys gambelii TaxID=257770 RepID=UPI0031402425